MKPQPSTGASAALSSSNAPAASTAIGTGPSANLKKSPWIQLTTIGENLDGHFSNDGKKIIFLSRERPSHAQAQVYEKILSTKTERRVTFQDGDNSSPRYDSRAENIFYASSTDELKENPLFLQRELGAMPETPDVNQPIWKNTPSDIYTSGLNGDHIQRLTDFHGFDGEIAPHPKGQFIYFSSIRSGRLQIYAMNIKTKGIHLVSKQPQLNESAVAISPDGQWLVWVQYADDFKSSQLVRSDIRGEHTATITNGAYLHLSPSWSPKSDEIVFSGNRDNPTNFDLFVIKNDGTCLRRFTEDGGQETTPSWSPDGTQLLFSSNRTGSFQLYLTMYQPLSGCL